MTIKSCSFISLFMMAALAAQSPLEKAQEQFRQGRFNEAEKLFGEALVQEPGGYEALIGLGRLRLYANRLTDAEKLLKKALAVKPSEEAPKLLLGELYYRQDRFDDAEPLFRGAGRKVIADKLAGFSGLPPYQIEGGDVATSVAFVQTDPLPVVRLDLNGEEGFFMIDTGGPELIVTPEFAAEAGVQKIVEAPSGGMMAGGRPAPAAVFAAVGLVQIGGFTLRNVPVRVAAANLSSLSGFSKPLSGILGTVLLSRFNFCLDYPGGNLQLWRRGEAGTRYLQELAGQPGVISMPFWLAGDHFILAQGTVNGTDPHLYLIDTGLIGGGVVLPESMIKEAKIEVSAESQIGMGGGGAVSSKTFVAREVTLGEARAADVKGVFGALTPEMEYMLGFRQAGIISHDFFKPFKVTFDLTNMRIILQRTNK